jgi:hypothetical protein
MKHLSSQNRLIQTTVEKFYIKAVKDFMLGYHFRKIQEIPSDHVLYPELEAFSKHIPRIIQFWEIQLLGHTAPEAQERPFNLLTTHGYLKIRKGELKRFSLLFLETIKEEQSKTIDSKNLKLLKTWQDKIKAFEKIFLNSKIIFS